jgi:arginine utilization protein RocB
MTEHINQTWEPIVARLTERLVAVRSVSPSRTETEAAREVLRQLGEDGLASRYAELSLDPIVGDPWERQNAYALVRGASSRTLVLLGHLDTVGTDDFGPLEPWALDPAGLEHHRRELEALPGVAQDLALHPSDWMFGRGAADMKSGVAACVAVVRRLAQEGSPLSVVLLATCDEENESAGVLQALQLLDALRARHGLQYLGVVNTDYTSARYLGDPNRYVYHGTIGKLLPAFFVVGVTAHAGEPFSGLDANVLAAELIRDLSMEPLLAETVGDDTTPPPVTLRAADLKERYDTQLADAAYFLLNVLTLRTGPQQLLDRLRTLVEQALARALVLLDDRERRWQEAAGVVGPSAPPRSGTVLSYHQLHVEVSRRLGVDRLAAALREEWERWPADADKRVRSVHLVARLWRLSGRQGPAVVMFYAPPYYPAVAPAPSELADAVHAVVEAHPELDVQERAYFPLLSDLSYLRLDRPEDLGALSRNMPVWQEAAHDRAGGYSLPSALIRRLDLPIVNVGPYGRGVHQPGEAVLRSYSFGVVPQLLYELVQRLAGR